MEFCFYFGGEGKEDDCFTVREILKISSSTFRDFFFFFMSREAVGKLTVDRTPLVLFHGNIAQ